MKEHTLPYSTQKTTNLFQTRLKSPAAEPIESLIVMRLLSLLGLIETQLPEPAETGSFPWKRQANYHDGRATLWQPELGLCLHLIGSELGEGRHSLTARWHGRNGELLVEQNHYCHTAAEWSRSAVKIAEACPEASPVDVATLSEESESKMLRSVAG